MVIKDIKDVTIALGQLAKAIGGYFNPKSYEARVLRGLVGTGSKGFDYADRVYNLAKAKGVSPKEHEMKLLRHYIRQWKANRDKLR